MNGQGEVHADGGAHGRRKRMINISSVVGETGALGQESP